MKYSKLFPKTLRNPPADEQSANAKLLEQAGFIRKHMAGVYNYLPLGLRVLNKISRVIREEMDAIGGQELYFAALQPKELWDKTGRWDKLQDIMYQFKSGSPRIADERLDMGLAITHEEVITDIASKTIQSYRDLPVYVYQIQTKFRNEPRPRFGLVRGREFLMKDLYSFDISEDAHLEFYKKCTDAYIQAFKRVGLNVKVTEASGGVFSKEYSHEFQVLIDSGEDEVIYCSSCDYAQNKQINELKSGDKCPRCGSKIKISNAIEVGNIFHLGTRFSEALGLIVTDEKGEQKPVIMGSYGWGPSRVMGTIVEVHHDDKGIIWPETVAPFMVHIVGLDLDPSTGSGQVSVKSEAERVYKLLQAEGIEVLFDDRTGVSAGEKFADADLIGIPYRVVISKKTLRLVFDPEAQTRRASARSGQALDKLEVKKRNEKETRFLNFEELLRLIQSKAL